MHKLFSYFPITIAVIFVIAAVFYFLTAENIPFLGEQTAPGVQRILPSPASKTPLEIIEESLPQKQEGKIAKKPEPIPGIVLIPEIQPKPPQQEPTAEESSSKIHIVSMGTDGFKPRIVVINAGDTVKWVNSDKELHWPASDPHPTHTGLAGFDPLADLLPGESYSFTFNDPGVYGYHDHTLAVVSGIATLTGIVRAL